MAMRLSQAILTLARRYGHSRVVGTWTEADVYRDLARGLTPAQVLESMLGRGNRAMPALRQMGERQLMAEAARPSLHTDYHAQPLTLRPARQIKVRSAPDGEIDLALRRLTMLHPDWFHRGAVTGREEGLPAKESPREWVKKYLESSHQHNPETLLESARVSLGIKRGLPFEHAEPDVDEAVLWFKNHFREAPAERRAAVEKEFRSLDAAAKKAIIDHVRNKWSSVEGADGHSRELLKRLSDHEIQRVIFSRFVPVEEVMRREPAARAKDAGERHLARHSAQATSEKEAAAFLQRVTKLKERMEAEKERARVGARAVWRRTAAAYRRAVDRLVGEIREGKQSRDRMTLYVEKYRERKEAIQRGLEEALQGVSAKYRREAEQLFGAKNTPYGEWVAAARNRATVYGEHGGPVRRALDAARAAGFWEYAGEGRGEADPRDSGNLLHDSLAARQEMAGWAPEDRTVNRREARAEMREALAPAIAALKKHIGHLSLLTRQEMGRLESEVRKYNHVLNYGRQYDENAAGEKRRGRGETPSNNLNGASPDPAVYARNVETIIARMNELEERIQAAHEEWMHLEDVAESGVTLPKEAPPAKESPAPTRVTEKARPGELLKALDSFTPRAEGKWYDPAQRLKIRELRNTVERAEEAYKKQLMGLQPAQRQSTWGRTDVELKSGRYAGYRLSEVPVSYLVWLATGARLRRESKSDTIKFGKEKYALPGRLPRTFYVDTFRMPDSEGKDELTGRNRYGAMPRLARRYLRTSEGSRRVEGWVGSYAETPWEEQAVVAMGLVPGMQQKSERIAAALRSNKDRSTRQRLLGDPSAREETKARLREITESALAKKRALESKRRAVAEEVFLPALNRALGKFAYQMDVATVKDLPADKREHARRIAHKEYNRALKDAKLDDYSILYAEGLGMRLSPEEAHWFARNIMKDSAEFGRDRTPAGYQDTALTEKMRKGAEEEMAQDFVYSQRAVIQFMKWADKERKRVVKANDLRGPKEQDTYYRVGKQAVFDAAKAAYQNFLDSHKDRPLPGFLRRVAGSAYDAASDRVNYRERAKSFEELTWEDIFRLGRHFEVERYLGRDVVADFLLPSDVLAFDPRLRAAERDKDYLSDQERAKADPRWRSRNTREGASWYDLQTPGAAMELSKLVTQIEGATTPRALDKAVRELVYLFYRGKDEERVMGILDRGHSDDGLARYTSVPDVRALMRGLDWGDTHPVVLQTIGLYVQRRHDVLTGKVREEETGVLGRDFDEDSYAGREFNIDRAMALYDGPGEGYDVAADGDGVSEEDFLHPDIYRVVARAHERGEGNELALRDRIAEEFIPQGGGYEDLRAAQEERAGLSIAAEVEAAAMQGLSEMTRRPGPSPLSDDWYTGADWESSVDGWDDYRDRVTVSGGSEFWYTRNARDQAENVKEVEAHTPFGVSVGMPGGEDLEGTAEDVAAYRRATPTLVQRGPRFIP